MHSPTDVFYQLYCVEGTVCLGDYYYCEARL